MFEKHHHSLKGIEIIVPEKADFRQQLVEGYCKLRNRKGVTLPQAKIEIKNYINFAAMMVKEGLADGMLAGAENSFPKVLSSTLRIVGRKDKDSVVAGLHMIQYKNKQYFLGDSGVNINPNAAELAEITLVAAAEMERLGIRPTVALLSFSNFGSVRVPETQKVITALEIVKKQRPDLEIDGPMQADIALNMEEMHEHFPFCELKNRPNLLIFPNLDAANISLGMLKNLSKINYIGPVMVGFSKSVHLITRYTPVRNIINMAAIATVDAQE